MNEKVITTAHSTVCRENKILLYSKIIKDFALQLTRNLSNYNNILVCKILEPF